MPKVATSDLMEETRPGHTANQSPLGTGSGAYQQQGAKDNVNRTRAAMDTYRRRTDNAWILRIDTVIAGMETKLRGKQRADAQSRRDMAEVARVNKKFLAERGQWRKVGQ